MNLQALEAELEHYLSPKETAALLGVTSVRITQLAQEGRIPFVNTPNGRLYPRDAIEQIDEERKAKKR